MTLMLYGMGTVFVFLSILIASTMLISWAVNRFAPESESAIEEVLSSTPLHASGGSQLDPTLLKVLQAAIRAHKKT